MAWSRGVRNWITWIQLIDNSLCPTSKVYPLTLIQTFVKRGDFCASFSSQQANFIQNCYLFPLFVNRIWDNHVLAIAFLEITLVDKGGSQPGFGIRLAWQRVSVPHVQLPMFLWLDGIPSPLSYATSREKKLLQSQKLLSILRSRASWWSHGSQWFHQGDSRQRWGWEGSTRLYGGND